MAIPVEIYGKTYFASHPTLDDLINFRDYLRRKRRQEIMAACPKDAAADEFDRYMQYADRECEKIDGSRIDLLIGVRKSSDGKELEGTTDIDGVVLLYYSLFRANNPDLDMGFFKSLLRKCIERDEVAIESNKNIRDAIPELLGAKKNPSKANPKAKNDRPPKKRRKRKKSASG